MSRSLLLLMNLFFGHNGKSDMDKQIRFYLPDFYYKYQLNTELAIMMRDHPEFFMDGISIGAIYGSFPGAIWNGGRLMSGGADQANIVNTIAGINNLGIPIRFTFTNCLLEKHHVYDTYCNLIMGAADNGMNEVLVNSPILEEYLRAKYPNFKYLMSTTRCERDVRRINEACKKYHLVVPDFRDNKDLDFLSRLEDKDKIELLVNAYCNPDCPWRSEHYQALSSDQLWFRNSATFVGCDAMSRPFHEALNLATTIKADELYGAYADMGFTNFKIEGRTLHTFEIIESYVHYLVKPEHKDRVRHDLVRICWS